MRFLIALGLTAILAIDLGYAFVLQRYEIEHHTKDAQTQKENQPDAEGPFLALGRAVTIRTGNFVIDEPEVLTALATIIMAVFTWRLWWSTDKLWKEAKAASEIARKSARAALIQASTMRSAERGYAKISHCNPLNLEVISDSLRFQMEIKNWGRTPIQVTHVFLSTYVVDVGDPLPPKPPYGISKPFHAFLVSMEPLYFWMNVLGSIGDQKREIQEGNKTLYLIGYVDYSDKFGNKHRGGYARQYGPLGPDLTFVIQDGYNYDENEKTRS